MEVGKEGGKEGGGINCVNKTECNDVKISQTQRKHIKCLNRDTLIVT